MSTRSQACSLQFSVTENSRRFETDSDSNNNNNDNNNNNNNNNVDKQ